MIKEKRLVEIIDVIGNDIDRLKQQRTTINKEIVNLTNRRLDFILHLETLRKSWEVEGEASIKSLDNKD